MNLSLAELEELEKKKTQDPPPPLPPIKAGDGTPTPADLEAARQKQERDAEEQRRQQAKTPEQLAEEQKQAHLDAGRNADGSEKTAEQKEADAKAAKELEEAEQDELALWQDVDKMWGAPLEVVYKNPEGQDIHPNTPEGIFAREKAVEKRAIERMDSFLETRDPRSYAYMLHRQAGGSDEDFFAQKTVTLPEYEKFKESVDLKTRVVTESLRLKGVPDNIIKLTIEDAVKNNTLDPLAEKEYRETEKREKDEITRLSNAQKQDQEVFSRSVQALDRSLEEEMASGMRVIVPDAKKVDFAKFVRERIEWDGARFVIAQPIEIKSLPRQLDALYFQFAQGNLSELVMRQAQTQNVKRLQRHVDKSKDGSPSDKGGGGRQKMTLGEI